MNLPRVSVVRVDLAQLVKNKIDIMTIAELHKLFLNSGKVTTDSRDIPAGSIFFALKGDNFDGNNFVLDALGKGAAFAVADDASLEGKDERIIITKDVLKTLQDLARFHRESLSIPVVGLTGTNGKTTTKELISCVLSAKYIVSYTKGNLNNHIGVPLTILRIEKDAEIAVIEMGASGPGEIELLASIARPSHALITNVGKAHLEGFGSFEGVKKTKGELYDFIKSNGGIVFYNADNSHLCQMLQMRGELNKIAYGLAFEGYKLAIAGEENPFVALTAPDGTLIKSNLIGGYNADNIITALAVGREFGISCAEGAKMVESYVPSNNRSQLVKGLRNTIIIDAYNANPTSMRASLENFINFNGDNKCLVIGDMLELGEVSLKEHSDILTLIKSLDPQYVFFVGKEFKRAAAEIGFDVVHAEFFDNSDVLNQRLVDLNLSSKTFLIKGSRGTKLEKVLDTLKS